MTGRAGGDILRPRRALRIASATTAVVALATVLGGPAAARYKLTAGSVGRMLGAPTSEPRMVPVVTPARVAKVAVVPGSREQEAWAFGHTHARRNGYAQSDPQGQGVFLRYTRSTGWRIWGPLQNQAGQPDNPGVASFDLAANGEGWGVGGTGLMFHRVPGGEWRKDDAASALASANLNDVDLKQDGQGVYGFAVGEGQTFMRLTGGRWQIDNAAGVGSSAELLGNLVSVATVDRGRAWAVAAGSRGLGIYRRTDQGWSQFLTGKTLYDGAPSAQSGSGGTPIVNQFASGASIAVAGEDVWIGGAIQPVDAQRYANQRGPGNDPTRPFVIHIDAAEGVHDYCPPIYQVSSSGVESTSRICEGTFPLATGSLHALTPFPNGEVVAGGFGFFRFRAGRWTRGANVAGIVSSGDFHSATEGWVSSYGNRTGEGLASSNSITLGHWTRSESRHSILRRWPHPSSETLESVALEPGGDGAVAVGGAGTIARLTPGVGWDVVASPTARTLHSVAWVSKDLAFAVGEGGTVLRYDGESWRADATGLTKNALSSVAFSSRDRGYAVGAKGTILAWNGSRWRLDPQSGSVTERRLVDVDFAGNDAIAVGERSAIVVNGGGRWVLDKDAPAKFATGQEGLPPHLMSVTGLPDGRAFAGGGLSLLIERKPGRPFDRSSMPILSGSIHTIEAFADARGKLRILASIGSASSRVAGPGIVEPQGWLFEGDGNGWLGAADARVAATGPDQDAPIRRDAVYAIAVGPDGRGFAVGGFPADLTDDDGHLATEPSGSIWRLDTTGNPEKAPGVDTIPIAKPAGTVSFAFLADTSCSDSICSAAAGSGMRGDELLTTALASIAGEAAAGRIAFTAFGGDMRRLGIPDELAPMNDLFARAGVPMFAALGDQDLYGGVGAAGQQQVLASNGYYLKEFAAQPRPWGRAKARPGFKPVDITGEEQAAPGQALTRYAFDYAPSGKALLRMIFLDTSRTPLAASPQNPPGDQSTFLQTALQGARAAGIPAIVVMHQPLVVPVSALPDASALTTTLTAGGAAAVLAAHERVNRLLTAPSTSAPGAFPVAIVGSAGSALGAGARPERGGYHAWHLVTVPVQGAAPSAVSVRAIPILESVALSSPDGRRVGAGKTLHFRALGRLPDVGPGHLSGQGGDPTQSRAATIRFPFPRGCALLESPESGCVPSEVLRPDHRFVCEDARVCGFVREDPQRPGVPARDGDGYLIEDPQSGFICAYAPGRTFVRIEAGTVAARAPIEVDGGEGSCIPRKIAAPVLRAPEEGTKPEPARPILDDKAVLPQLLKPRVPDLAVVAAVAPPPVNPAPAPPGGGAARKEEREAAGEKAEMTALPVRKHSTAGQAGLGVLAGIAAVIGALLLGGRPAPRPSKGLAYAGRLPDVGAPTPMRGHRVTQARPAGRKEKQQ